jgi:hypothetical protein
MLHHSEVTFCSNNCHLWKICTSFLITQSLIAK